MKSLIIACAALLLVSPAIAADATTYEFDGSFDDATFAVENEIIGKGLTIDYVAHSGEMLARTAADVASDVTLFEAADIFVFCSAVLSRKVMEIDPDDIAYCPYAIFVTDRQGVVRIGFVIFQTARCRQFSNCWTTLSVLPPSSSDA